MRPRNLLLLFLLVAGLGAFIYFVDRDLPSTDEQTQEAGKLLPLESDEVTQLVLTHGEETVRFERTPAQEVDGKPGVPGDWGLTEPLVARADQGAVDRLVSTLTSLRTERTLEDYDAAGLGLEAPRATVMLGTGKATTTVRVGAEIPASSTTVVAIDGRSFAYVIQDSVVSELLRSVGEWRARDLLPGTRPEIRTVALSTADRTVVVARQGDRDEFTFEVPGKELSDRLAEDHADTLLKALTGLRVERFLSPVLEPAVSAGIPVSCCSIAYRTPPGEPPAHEALCWWGDMGFVDHALAMLALPGFRARLVFGETAIREADRKVLARRLQAAVGQIFTPTVEGAAACRLDLP